MDFSIIIPVYNEIKKISQDIKEAEAFLMENKIDSEIIIVDDGSSDGTKEKALEKAKTSKIPVHVLGYDNHMGKGTAVKTGIIQSKGKFVMFADSGSCIPYRYAETGLDFIKNKTCHIAHGSRKLKDSIITRPQPWHRKIMSKLINIVLVIWAGLPRYFTDTQCGFKIYDGEIARELYRDCQTQGFLFDIEIILRAVKKEYLIKEFPVHWTADLDSRLEPFKNFMNIFTEVYRIRKILKS